MDIHICKQTVYKFPIVIHREFSKYKGAALKIPPPENSLLHTNLTDDNDLTYLVNPCFLPWCKSELFLSLHAQAALGCI